MNPANQVAKSITMGISATLPPTDTIPHSVQWIESDFGFLRLLDQTDSHPKPTGSTATPCRLSTKRSVSFEFGGLPPSALPRLMACAWQRLNTAPTPISCWPSAMRSIVWRLVGLRLSTSFGLSTACVRCSIVGSGKGRSIFKVS